MSNPENRSYDRFTSRDYERLSELALEVFDDLFRRRAKSAVYDGRLVMIALCQGGALHQLDGTTGIGDLDIFAFFAGLHRRVFVSRKPWTRDFGGSHLGRDPDEQGYGGRRVDIIPTDIPVEEGQDAVVAVKSYLIAGARRAHWLKKKPVIAVWPEELRGRIIWDLRDIETA